MTFQTSRQLDWLQGLKLKIQDQNISKVVSQIYEELTSIY